MRNLSVTPTVSEMELGLGYFGFQFLVLPSIFSLLTPVFAPNLSEAGKNLIYFILNFLCLCAIMHRFLISSIRHFPEHPRQFITPTLISFCSFWLFSLAFRWFSRQIAPGFYNANDAAIAQMVQSNYIATAIGTVLLAPVAEELVFRGLIFRFFHSRSRLLAYCVSCAVFALIHILDYFDQLSATILFLSFLQYLPAGFFPWLGF